MNHTHETATLAWLRAEGVGTTVVLVEQHRGRIRPATDLEKSTIATITAINKTDNPKVYDVTSSAGEMGLMGASTVFTLATPEEVAAFERVASRL